MFRNSVTPDGGDSKSTGTFRSIRDRFHFKRNPSPSPNPRLGDRQSKAVRSHHHRSSSRKLNGLNLRARSWLYLCVFVVIFGFVLASIVLQSSIVSLVGGGGETARWRWSVRGDLKVGSSLRFLPQWRLENRLDRIRTQPRMAIRRPRLGLILGNMDKNPSSLMLITVVENLLSLGYSFQVFAKEDGSAHSLWQEIGGQVSILGPEKNQHIDWTLFEGIVVASLEAKDSISSLMQEPFSSVPLIWIVEEDILAQRLQLYESMDRGHLISHWKTIFQRADAVVFSDFSFPMLYSLLDTGNFFVIPGSPRDIWDAESYSKTHSRTQLRLEYGFDKEDILILVVGSSFFYNELSWNYAVTMHDIESLLVKYAGGKDIQETSKFIFLGGNSSDGYRKALQDVSSRLGLKQGSLLHFGLDDDVNHLILMSDIALYASPQNEQGFPSMLIRVMSFGLPTIAPDYPIIKKYVTNGVHGLIFSNHEPGMLSKAFSLLLVEGKLSNLAHSIASSGRLLAKNMLVEECVTDYALLLENVVNFPSDVLLPSPISNFMQKTWEWHYFQDELDQTYQFLRGSYLKNSSVVYELEEDMSDHPLLKSETSNNVEKDFPSRIDWEILGQIERAEEVEVLELKEIEERMEMDIGEWDVIYRNARKAEKIKFENNERDEGELERTGQPVCIYEIYKGAGAWPFLHHGSLYRGLSLSTKSRRLTSDDVDAVGRLPLLNDTYYSDLLCEISGMFSIANQIDDIHKRPWIGFQSWRAAGRMVSLSTKAEQVLEKSIQENTKGDVLYFWEHLDMEWELLGSNDPLTFWSMCDVLNGGNCRTAFEDAFRLMYALPSNVEALPPMPEDGGHWSALHSWVMPTPSFLEFVMFSRMFVDSLHALQVNSTSTSQCLFDSSYHEKQHCYCQVLEPLVNVWAYHSGRRMVYIDPHSGSLQEQHDVEDRKGFMWAKYFNSTLLKSMDEDLAEAADDNDHPYENWLWPLTGEIYWQGTYEREREERYRMKMDKKRKLKEKLLERMKFGYKQKTLGG